MVQKNWYGTLYRGSYLMPYYEYICEDSLQSHTITKFFKTFEEAEPFIDELKCDGHGCFARRIPSLGSFALYGNPDGYHNPSPTKRFTTKTVNQKDGNTHSIG